MQYFRSIFILLGLLTTLLLGVFLLKSASNSTNLDPQQVPIIPRDLLFGNPEKKSPQISPNGKKLAYIAPNAQNVLNVWVKDLTDSKKADEQVTNDTSRGIRSFFWQLDNEHLLYVQDRDGDENWHLYQTSLLTKETKDLTPYEEIQAQVMAYQPEYPDHILVGYNLRDKSLFDVYDINLKTGEASIVAVNPDNVIDWAIDHQLEVRAAKSYTKDGSALVRVRDGSQGEWREILTTGPQETTELVGFTADDQGLYLLTSLGHDTSRLIKIDLASNESQVVAEDPRYDLAAAFLKNPQTHELEAIGVEREKLEWMILDPQVAQDFDFLSKQDPRACFKIVSRTLDNNKWIIGAYSDQRPAYFYLYDRDQKATSFLFSAQPALEKYPLSAMHPVSYKAQDGMEIYGYLTLPAGQEAKQLPTILLVHGGPWVRDSWEFDPEAQWLANRGYAVFQINYRGSTGYGKTYLNAGNREWAAKMHQDLLDGKQWLIDQGIADSKRVAIYGGSYGGYAALVGLAFTPDEFCCGVDIVGPSNLITLLQTLPSYWEPLKVEMDIRIGKLETEEAFLKSRSPLFKANQIKKPLLIAQGANDPRVKQAESDQIVNMMREHNLPVDYLLFADEGHGFARPENRLKFMAASECFLARYLGGRCQPPSDAENWESLKR